jgi:HEPN domain-containing protein
MDQATRELVRAWLLKARNDLATARKVASDPDPYLDTAIYHCQQAAEKVIKGFLTFHGERFDKIHYLPLLLTQAISCDARLNQWLDVAERLTPYVTLFRYPGEFLEPEPDEFARALADAEQLYAFVIELLPREVHP